MKDGPINSWPQASTKKDIERERENLGLEMNVEKGDSVKELCHSHVLLLRALRKNSEAQYDKKNKTKKTFSVRFFHSSCPSSSLDSDSSLQERS